MKYPNGKQALNLIVVSFFITLIAGIVSGIVSSFVTGTAASVISIICNVASLVAAIILLVAYAKAGKDSKSFAAAFKVEIFCIIANVIEVVLVFVYLGTAANVVSIIGSILGYVVSVISILTFYYVCQGCSELCEDEKITKLSKTTMVWYTIGMVLSLVASIVTLFISNASTAEGVLAVAGVAGVLAVISAIVSFVAEIIQLVLIFKARATCK